MNRKLLAAALLVTSAAAAHEVWLEAPRFRLQPGATVHVRAFVGQNFRGGPWTTKAAKVQRLVRYGPADSTDLTPTAATDTFRTAFTFARPGTHVVLLQSTNSFIELPAKEFTAYPDSTWTYKSMVALNPEDGPKITDFRVWNDEGDYTPELLRGNKLVLIIQNVDKADRDRYTLINQLFADAKESRRNITPLIITSSSPAEFDVFRHSANFAVPFYYADATVLKSIIRSNPGFVILKDGVVKAKYHYHDIPSIGKVEEKL